MGTITATWQTSPYERAMVQLGSWSTTGPVSVFRVHADGTRWPVRGVPDTSGGASLVYDYEAPPGTIYYEAADGTLVTSAPVVATYSASVLRVPGQPGAQAVFELLRRPQEVRDRPTNLLRPLGRRTAVPLHSALGAPAFTLEVETHTTAEDEALDRVLEAAGVLLLICPALRKPWRYVSIPQDSVTAYAPGWDAADGVGQWEQRALPMTEVGYPVGGVLGDPTASYQAIVDKGWTYQQLLDWKVSGATTYLQVLMGGY